MRSALQKQALRLIANGNFVCESCLSSDFCNWRSEFRNSYQRYLSVTTQSRPIKEGSSREVLLKTIGISLKEHRIEEAWKSFTDFRCVYGFPEASTLSELINGFSYSSDCIWLQKAYSLVIKVLKEKPELIRHDSMIRLCLSLARAQMVVPASKILRLMMWKQTLLPMETFCIVVMHMVKTQVGTYLVCNILNELCDHISHCCGKKSNSGLLPKPSTRVFNLVLDACVRFQSALKGQKIIELMAKIGVVADVESIILFSCIYEINGQRDQLKKFKDHVDKVSHPIACHYKLFYDNLLRLHFKFSDIDSANGLIADMYKCRVALPSQSGNDLASSCFVPIGSQYSKNVLQIRLMPELAQKDSILLIDDGQEEFVTVKNGRLVLSTRGIAQFIVRYKESSRTSELSKLIIDIQIALQSSGEGDFCFDVIEACIRVGWLDTAHDILDDLKLAGISVSSMAYMLLYAAYCKEKMFREAEVLAEQMEKLGIVLNKSDEEMNSDCHSNLTESISMDSVARKSELAEALILEIKNGHAFPSLVYELNCSIYFFSKAKMMEDASNAYQNMQKMNIIPTVQTYFYLTDGYSSLGMYRDITILWGEIKRNMKHKSCVVNADLYELLLLNFIRGGYFERVLEVIGLMEEKGFCVDKWKCKNEYLKIHKNLYRSLTAEDAKTEAQRKRLEHVELQTLLTPSDSEISEPGLDC
ncbi:hypothetical protein V2J09_019095 [Rumex salicifolius]